MNHGKLIHGVKKKTHGRDKSNEGGRGSKEEGEDNPFISTLY